MIHVKKKHKTILISIISFCILLGILFINSSYYKIKTLYKNPIKLNQKYKNYIYDEYTNHIAIVSYTGEEKEVVIPDFINDKPVYSIDDSAFYANSKIEKVTLPKYTIRVGHQSFIGNANLKEVVLNDKLVDIGNWAFKGCPNLEKIYAKKGSKTDKTIKKTDFKKYLIYK